VFVSPGQVNYLLPEGLAEGAAEVSIENGSAVQKGPVAIRNAAPGLFTANGDGKGVAAAIALRFAGGKLVNSAPVFRYDSGLARCAPSAIYMGTNSDRVFVSLYGTGLRHAGAVAATILGRTAPVTWSGPNSVYAGLDQVNVEIPRSLLGRGPLTVRLTAGGVEANPVAIELEPRPYLNLDFETATVGLRDVWNPSGAGYSFYVDASAAYSGRNSLRIQNFSATSDARGVAAAPLSGEGLRGRRVRFSAYIKTEAMTRGWADLSLRVEGAAGTLATGAAAGPTGTTDWVYTTIDREISPDAAEVVLEVLQNGDGTAWYDALSLEVDGEPYSQPGPPAGEPSAAQLDWVRANAIPVVTPDAGRGFDDLERVRNIVGDARVVGLGEATHGTSEFFRMKHRLLEFLATHMGFTLFAIEANMPEAYRLNDYVLNGTGDPATLLKGMYFWTWNTQEVLDMIHWMREFNRSGRGPVQFTGFDMQTATVAMDIVRQFVSQAEPSFLPTLDAAWNQARAAQSGQASEVEQAAAAARQVWQHLDQDRSAYRAGFADAAVEWAIQNGKIVEQATYVLLGGSLYRDRSIAENMEWILDQNPGAKAVVWAHNYHVSRTPGATGSHLDRNHGEDYRVLGFAFHEGRYSAVTRIPGGYLSSSNIAVPSFPGSAEYYFHSTGIPSFILDLRLADAADPASAWLLGPIHNRYIGAVAVAGYYLTARLAADYDAMIYFDQTGPSVLLP
jgi:erythromycin esterase